MLSELPVGECVEVLGMITKNVGELAHVVLAQADVDLVILKCFLEVNSDLSSNLSELVSWKARIAALSEEKILRLRKTEVAIHLERLFSEIQGRFSRRDLGDEAHELVEDPGGLLKVVARLSDAVTTQVHVASHTREADSVVVHR